MISIADGLARQMKSCLISGSLVYHESPVGTVSSVNIGLMSMLWILFIRCRNLSVHSLGVYFFLRQVRYVLDMLIVSLLPRPFCNNRRLIKMFCAVVEKIDKILLTAPCEDLTIIY